MCQDVFYTYSCGHGFHSHAITCTSPSRPSCDTLPAANIPESTPCFDCKESIVTTQAQPVLSLAHGLNVAAGAPPPPPPGSSSSTITAWFPLSNSGTLQQTLMPQSMATPSIFGRPYTPFEYENTCVPYQIPSYVPSFPPVQVQSPFQFQFSAFPVSFPPAPLPMPTPDRIQAQVLREISFAPPAFHPTIAPSPMPLQTTPQDPFLVVPAGTITETRYEIVRGNLVPVTHYTQSKEDKVAGSASTTLNLLLKKGVSTQHGEDKGPLPPGWDFIFNDPAIIEAAARSNTPAQAPPNHSPPEERSKTDVVNVELLDGEITPVEAQWLQKDREQRLKVATERARQNALLREAVKAQSS